MFRWLFTPTIRLDRRQFDELVSAIRGTHPREIRLIAVRVIDLETGFMVTGEIRSMKMSDSQKCSIEFGAPVDKKGNATEIEKGSEHWTVDDPTIADVVQDPDDPFKATVVAQKPGNTFVRLRVDADVGEGVRMIEGVEPLQVTAGEAVALGEATVGAPEEQEPATPPTP